jgi:hypothetical protein
MVSTDRAGSSPASGTNDSLGERLFQGGLARKEYLGFKTALCLLSEVTNSFHSFLI